MKRKELLIGILAVLALAILFFGINFLKGVNIFKAANYFYASYTNVEGLTQSAPVTLNGYKIGIVRDIHYDYNNPGHVIVELSLDKQLLLPKGTEGALTTDLLGTASIALKPGNPADGYYNIGDTIIATKTSGLMDAVSTNLMPAVSTIFPKIDTLITNLNAITSDPALTASVKRLDNITLELQATMKSLNDVMTQLRPVASNVTSITANVDTITGDLAAVSGMLRNAPVDTLMASLQASLANLEVLTNDLNNPDGTLGKLSKDPALYENLNATVASLDSLFIDIKRNPKRYVTIKVF